MGPMTVVVAKDSAGGGTSDPARPPSGPEAEALAGAIEVIAGFVAGFEPARYGGEDAAVLVAWFTRAERLCGAGKTLAATRVAESHRHQTSGHRTPADWLASVTGESVGHAVEVLQLGQSLDRHPAVAEALRGGQLSTQRAGLVTRAARVNPLREDELVAGARSDTLRQLRQRCLRAQAEGRSAHDAEAARAALQASRRCRTWTEEDGAVRLDARLAPEAGAALCASLRAQCDRVFERARRDGVHEPPDAYAADALVALVTGRGILGPGRPRSTTPSTSTTTSSPDEDGPAGQGTSSSTGPTTQPSTGCRAPDPKATVHLRVDLDALRRGSLSPGEVCEIPGVGPVPVQTARDLLGDALCDLVITNGTDVTTVCHLGRSIPAALNTALLERDRHCVVPGCDATHRLERDHWIVSFAHGGAATLENLARLCAHHHRLCTHQGFQLHGGPGRWRWEPPAAPRAGPTKRTRKRSTRTATTTRPTTRTDPTLFTTRE
jgi:hypothetical protein